MLNLTKARVLILSYLFYLLYSPIAFANGKEVEQGFSLGMLLIGALIGFIIGVLSTYVYFLKTEIRKEGEKEIFISMPGLTEAENRILLKLIENKGKLSQDELSKLTKLSKSRISDVVSSMEKKGIIKKLQRGRANVIVLKEDFLLIKMNRNFLKF